MAITPARCHVLQADVARVTDLEGRVTQVICPEYDSMTGACRLKVRSHDAGPLSQLLVRMSEDAMNRRGTHCDLR